ncbi:monocarboxylate transporter 13 [Chanos chanos]|uniref:Monocarboxylate transporter 13 n=1 Tax=Chanos chanos TaxID=29144 RepID=A0A6J2VSH2_CHACN|nr:monocarboxylate transporter 13 [Chanos chanos]XP_030636051.1 monocarboxylate transporter 13 [Chanos chanos]XP_030636052.1 monocarboxylate transporter 13 [Chanos chanos]
MAKSQGQKPTSPIEGPDGGWGWVVVGSLFVASALVFGLIRSLGVFFVEFVQYFGESAQAVSWITSIGVAMQQLFSPVGTALCNAYGARPVVMMGGFLSGLGLILASQASTLRHLYLTMGLISGAGWAFVFTPTVASVMQYFTARRSLAMGLGFTGVGLSSFAFSPLFQYLVEAYAWRGALLILGGLSLNMVACGALIRPIGSPKTLKMSEKLTGVSRYTSLLSQVCVYLELSLLCSRAFLTYAMAITFFNVGYFVPYVHLVAHCRQMGFSEYQAAFVISATGITDIVGRVVSGWASDLGHLRLPHMLTVWTGLLGLFMLLLPVSGSYPGLLTVSLAYGFCAGAMTPLVFAVVPEIVGMSRMLGALGLLQLIESIGGLFGAPMSGWLKDCTGFYTASFMVAGSFLILGTVVTATLPHFCSCSNPPPPCETKKTPQDHCVEDGLMKHISPSESTSEKLQLSFPEVELPLHRKNSIPDLQSQHEDTNVSNDNTEHDKCSRTVNASDQKIDAE